MSLLFEWKACCDFVSDSVLPIMQIIDSERAVVLGTGFLIENNSRTFLITARHIFDMNVNMQYEKIAIPLYGPKQSMLTLPHKPYLSKRVDNCDADIAVIPLLYDENELHKCYWKHFTLKSFFTKNFIIEGSRILVYGYPVGLQTSYEADPFINIGVVSFFTSFYKGNTDSIEGYNPTIDLLFEFKSKIQIDGIEQYLPELHGISGSPLFYIDNAVEGVWSPEKHLKIVGIEKAVKKGDYIRATQSGCIYKSLVGLFKEIEESE